MKRFIRGLLIGVCFVVGSVALFVGVASILFVPKITVWDRVFPVWPFTIALLLDLGLARWLSRSGKKSFIYSLALVTFTMFIGAVVTSMAAMRGNWWEIMKETFGPRLLGLCFFLLTVSAFSESGPKTMTKLVVQLQQSDLPANSFAAKPKTIFRAGSRYCRIEEAEDHDHGIQGLIIINEPDAWFINALKNTGRHRIDPGPAFNCRLPIFRDDKSERSPKPEFGQELAYFKNRGINSVPGPVLFDRPTKAYEIDEGDYQLQLFTTGEPERPVAIKRGEGTKWEIYLYSIYEEIPFENKLFAKPKGVTIEEAK